MPDFVSDCLLLTYGCLEVWILDLVHSGLGGLWSGEGSAAQGEDDGEDEEGAEVGCLECVNKHFESLCRHLETSHTIF